MNLRPVNLAAAKACLGHWWRKKNDWHVSSQCMAIQESQKVL